MRRSLVQMMEAWWGAFGQDDQLCLHSSPVAPEYKCGRRFAVGCGSSRLRPMPLVPLELGNHGNVSDVDLVHKISVDEESDQIVRSARRGVGKKCQHAETRKKNFCGQTAINPVRSRAHSTLIQPF